MHIINQKRRVQRVLFDLDGTLFDTQTHHAQAEAALLREYGVETTAEAISAKYAGRPTEHVFKEMLSCSEELARELAVRKWEKIFPFAKEAKSLCDVRKLFLELTIRNIAYSIGTASPVQWAYNILAANDLTDLIDRKAIIGGDMVKRGKPDPAIWIKASLSTPLHNCFVVEDGIAGIQAAMEVRIPCALLLPRKYENAHQIACASDILSLI
jgi:beta-phosphoglucomutase-like phosphatase (HAD superfamily)